jgi:hypothetical protein
MTGEADTLNKLRPEDQPAIALDPRPCEHCGLTLDDHFTVDQGDGPEHFCQPLDVVLHLRAAALQEAWERADPRDAWMHTGEPPPPDSVRNGPQAEPCRQSNRPAQSTVDAFLHLARHDRGRLAAWLANHPQDVRGELFKLWESKS